MFSATSAKRSSSNTSARTSWEKAPHYLPHGRSLRAARGPHGDCPASSTAPRGRPRKLRGAQVSFHSLGFYYPPQDCGPLNSVLAPLPPAWGCSYGARPRALFPTRHHLVLGTAGFQGFFDDLFVPEDLALWNRWETGLGAQNLPREVPPLRDMFIYECVRVNMGCETYAQFQRALGMLGPAPVLPLLATPTFVPTEQDFSDFYRVTPLDAFQESVLEPRGTPLRNKGNLLPHHDLGLPVRSFQRV